MMRDYSPCKMCGSREVRRMVSRVVQNPQREWVTIECAGCGRPRARYLRKGGRIGRPPKGDRQRRLPEDAQARRDERLERERAMVQMRSDGCTLEEIGVKYSLSRERVRQIVAPHVPNAELRERKRAARAAQFEERLAELRAPVLEQIRAGEGSDDIRHHFNLTRAEYARIARSDEMAYRMQRSRQTRAAAPSRDVIPDLQAAAEILGRTPGAKAYDNLRKAGQLPAGALSAISITARYGWAAACEAAGLKPNARPSSEAVGARQYSDEDYVQMIASFYARFGHWPSVNEWNELIGSPCAAAIRHRFNRADSELGGWAVALAAAAAFP